MAFTHLTQLKGLFLSFTQLVSVDHLTFPSSLTSLHLNNNPISSLSSDAFTSLANLEVLYLYDTHLTRLPLALTSLTHLEHLDFGSHPNMTCSCSEAAPISHWYVDRLEALKLQNILGDMISGYCGDGTTSISYFLEEFATLCPVL